MEQRRLGPDGRQAGRGVPIPQRGLVALDRARADAEAVAGSQVRYEAWVFGVGVARESSARSKRSLENPRPKVMT
jgi:hypothetical protein